MAISGKHTALICYLLIAILFLLHLPFLHADPDFNLSDSRDAFTDEGLNTSQLRNFINHGQLDFDECDNLVKTPLFNAALYVPLLFFGTQLEIARLTILLLLLTICIIAAQSNLFRQWLLLLIPVTLLQYFVFQYSHFSLSEMLSVGCIFLSCFFLEKFSRSNFLQQRYLFLASLFIAFAYYSKIQFLYIIPVIAVSLIIFRITSRNQQPQTQPSNKMIFYAVAWMLFFLAVYIAAWYMPHRDTFDFVMKNEAGDKYARLSDIPRTVAFNTIFILFGGRQWIFNTLVILSFMLGCYCWKKTSDLSFRFLFISATVWLVLECHKLSMIYLPARYLVSYYFAGGFMSSLVLAKILFTTKIDFTSTIANKNLKYCALFLTAIFILNNSMSYVQLVNERQFQIKRINSYFSTTVKDDRSLIMGPWSPSFNWNSRAYCKPVWRDFMNDNAILAQHPLAIISEPGEEESNQAYSSQGLILSEHADSIRTFNVGRWTVNVYWMKNE
jgi:hypothetical protein